MKVTFTGRQAFDVERVSVSIQVQVDGNNSRVILPIEYLQDNFGLHTSGSRAAMQTYEENQVAILDIAQRVVDSLTAWQDDFILTSELMAEFS